MISFILPLLKSSFPLEGPLYAAGTSGAFPIWAIVTAPLFNGTSSDDLVPLGKMPTIFPSFNSLIGVLIFAWPGIFPVDGKSVDA